MKGWLLDTNVVSELRKPNVDPRVDAWQKSVDRGALYTSLFVMAELRYGIDRLTDTPLRQALEEWLTRHLPVWFGSRILGVDQATADLWISLKNEGQQRGRTYPQPDLLIAATALRHGLVIASRNARDFDGTGAAVLNPWET